MRKTPWKLSILRFLLTKELFLDMEKVGRDYFLVACSNFPNKFPVDIERR